MTFISYAQNFEDVMLWRALKHVSIGSYIDVGANDPTIDSVTKAFYDRGWSGINIEPIRSHINDLNRERPRDINIECAAGESNGEIEVWECDVRGWATASTPVMTQYQNEGHKGVAHKVPVSSLTEICMQHVQGEIHFLKIDVEGFEKNVLLGMDFTLFRPWILIVEATEPNSVAESYKEWEEIVLATGYIFAYADGLNRFYVSEEHKELLPSLKYPPNVFDDFIRSDRLNSEMRARQAESKAQEAEMNAELAQVEAREAQSKVREAQSKAQEAEARERQMIQEAEINSRKALTALAAVYSSRSWRITAPLRWTGKVMHWFLRGSISWLTLTPGSRPRRILGNLLIFIKSEISTRPLLKAEVVRLLSPFPRLSARLRLIGTSHFNGCSHRLNRMVDGIECEGIENYSPEVQKIFFDLKAAIEERRKERC